MSSSQPTTPHAQRKKQPQNHDEGGPSPTNSTISHHPSRIPVAKSISPVPFASRRRSRSSSSTTRPVRMSNSHQRTTTATTTSLLTSTTLQQHNKNLQQARHNIDRNHQLFLKFNRSCQQPTSSMEEAKSSSDSNEVDSGGGGGDELDKSENNNSRQPRAVVENCAARKKSISNGRATNDRGGMTLNLSSPHCPMSSSRSPFNSYASSSRTTPQTPRSISASRKSCSPKTPPVTPDRVIDDDLDSLHSYSSMASSNCDHPYFARNGTTFSGRKMKYVVHCSNYAGQTGDDYLTPTQRAQKHLRRLKELLAAARADLEMKDSEILKLTREVVELRLFKASLSSPDECSKSSDCNSVPTVRENTTNDLQTPASEIASPMMDMAVDDGMFKTSPRHQANSTAVFRTPIHQAQYKLCNSEMASSFADSGHFDDITTSSIHSKEDYASPQERNAEDDEVDQIIDPERQRLVQMYEEKIEELIKNHDNEMSEEKRSNNNRLDALLQRLSECNSRYCDLMPDYEQAKERIRELEKELESLQQKLNEQEDKSNKMYLHMYKKDCEAGPSTSRASMEQLPGPSTSSSNFNVGELMHQLQVTNDELANLRDDRFCASTGMYSMLSAKEAISLWLLGARKTMYKRMVDAHETKPCRVDPEVTLQFLRSAIYYFLTDKENSQGHLRAIESILGFTEKEKEAIERAMSGRK